MTAENDALQVDGAAPETVKPLDVVAMPAGKSQLITNSGKTDLIFLCVSTTRHREGVFVNLGG
jgi:mannose-6-phosphate isomerase-like protein (cupin superfamily)